MEAVSFITPCFSHRVLQGILSLKFFAFSADEEFLSFYLFIFSRFFFLEDSQKGSQFPHMRRSLPSRLKFFIRVLKPTNLTINLVHALGFVKHVLGLVLGEDVGVPLN